MKIDIGISEQNREAIAEGLSRLLADSYTLYLKTHNYHWNVTGPMFSTLHNLFEQEYTELATAVDEIAERIRALGVAAPGSYKQFAELSSVEEETGKPPEAQEMIRRLVTAQEQVVKTAREVFPLAEEAHDEPTADLLTRFMRRMPGCCGACSTSKAACTGVPTVSPAPAQTAAGVFMSGHGSVMQL